MDKTDIKSVRVKAAKKPEPEITDEEFYMVLQALFGPYKGPGWNPE